MYIYPLLGTYPYPHAVGRMARRQEALEGQSKYREEFTAALASIIDAVHSKNQSDPVVLELRSKFALARNQPALILENAGPFVWEYREYIAAGDATRFLNMNFDEKIQKHVSDTSQINYIKSIIGKLRTTWETFNPRERAALVSLLQTMLRSFSGHAAGERLLATIEAERREREQRTGVRLPPR